tara:strand:+ start:1301 stop:1531 length:231 start_codon:yes stop_codon:yes gene_type:complete
MSADPAFEGSRGRFGVKVREYEDRASLTIYFRVSEERTFTWHLSHRDLESLQHLLGMAGKKMQRLYLDTESKKKRL